MNNAELTPVTKSQVLNLESTSISQAVNSPVQLIYKYVESPRTLKEKFLFATFEIIGEQGASALSANELIRKTESSKGALFHHFKTLDDLCLESLSFFIHQIPDSLRLPRQETLQDFLSAFVMDTENRHCNRFYFHLAHFFNDRALRDERFRNLMQEAYNLYTETTVNEFMKYLSPTVDRSQVREVVMYLNSSLEQSCYQRVMMSPFYNMRTAIDWTLQVVLEKLEQASQRLES